MDQNNLEHYRLTFYLETNPSSLRSILVPGGRSNRFGTTLNTGEGGGGGGGWFCKHRKGCVNNCTQGSYRQV